MTAWTLRLSSLAACLLAASCSHCELGPCRDANAEQNATDIEQGIAGVVAYQTDGCDNDCCACSWTKATLAVWSTTEELTDRDALVARVLESGPNTQFDVDRRYEHDLPDGHHLVCASESCTSLTIPRDKVVTLNLLEGTAGTTLKVFVAGKARKDRTFFEVAEAVASRAGDAVEP